MRLNWEHNPSFGLLATPAQGDIVHLKLRDGWVYRVKVIVSSVRGDDVEALVESIFDWSSHDLLSGSDVLHLVGKGVFIQARLCPRCR